MDPVPSFEQALLTVKEKLRAAKAPRAELIPLERSLGRVLAQDLAAFRDFPPFHRSARDGYAVRSADVAAVPVALECAGEIAAGAQFSGRILPGYCAAILTGAPLPDGADAVVMVEETSAQDSRVEIRKAVRPFDNVVTQGSEAQAGALALSKGSRLGPAQIALLAANGKTDALVFQKPSVAILTTGNELVPVSSKPESFQIYDSNAAMLRAQVERNGAEPVPMGIARDDQEYLKTLLLRGLESDLLLITGGVSVGKYDFVEAVLAELGAVFYFRAAAIRPGKPVVFGRVRDRFFFGLPGNPLSVFVTFEILVRPALAALTGASFEEPVFTKARLASSRSGKAGLTVFSPARLEMSEGEPVIDWVASRGSGDLVSLASANAFIVQHPDQTLLRADDWVDVLPKPA